MRHYLSAEQGSQYAAWSRDFLSPQDICGATFNGHAVDKAYSLLLAASSDTDCIVVIWRIKVIRYGKEEDNSMATEVVPERLWASGDFGFPCMNLAFMPG